jgi:threonine/homoserine/homoserine lactone efflux protein
MMQRERRILMYKFKAYAEEAERQAVSKILLNPKVWVAFLDFVSILLLKQFGVELEPELFATLQALVLVVIATMKDE